MQLTKFASYAEYIATQTRVSSGKLGSLWMTEHDVEAVARVVERWVPAAKTGVCHGVRNGWEVHHLRARLGFDVIGTEISDAATQFANVIQWDFHELKPEWVGYFDFVYSNSLDHSYDPSRCVESWMRSLRAGGVCIIHWSGGHKWGYTPADCFSATKAEYLRLITDRYALREEIAVPRVRPGEGRTTTYLLVVGHPS